MNGSTHEFFDTLAQVLLYCWVFDLLLLVTWAGVFVLARKLIYRLHGSLFGLSEHDLSVIHYCGIAFVKLCVILFFFFPWAAIRLLL